MNQGETSRRGIVPTGHLMQTNAHRATRIETGMTRMRDAQEDTSMTTDGRSQIIEMTSKGWLGAGAGAGAETDLEVILEMRSGRGHLGIGEIIAIIVTRGVRRSFVMRRKRRGRWKTGPELSPQPLSTSATFHIMRLKVRD